MRGSVAPNQWVLRGNHRDGWVFGAADPLSGQVAMLEEAKAIGQLANHGWRPKRSIVYLSWDGEEPGLLGSTEWVEAHAAELQQKAVLDINSDNNDRGVLSAGGNHDWEHFVNLVAQDVIDPETNASVAQRRGPRWRSMPSPREPARRRRRTRKSRSITPGIFRFTLWGPVPIIPLSSSTWEFHRSTLATAKPVPVAASIIPVTIPLSIS